MALNSKKNEKALGETQTLRAGCRGPKIFTQGAQDGQNLISWRNFIYRPSLVKSDARNFELSW